MAVLQASFLWETEALNENVQESLLDINYFEDFFENAYEPPLWVAGYRQPGIHHVDDYALQ